MGSIFHVLKGCSIDFGTIAAVIDQLYKSQNAPVPYPTMLHSEQKCAHTGEKPADKIKILQGHIKMIILKVKIDLQLSDTATNTYFIREQLNQPTKIQHL